MVTSGTTDPAKTSNAAGISERSRSLEHADRQPFNPASQSLLARLRSPGISALFVLLAIVLLLAGSRLIASNAVSVAVDEIAPPLPVQTTHLKLESHYQVPESFIGLIEPQRQTDLGFEAGGTVVEILVEEGDTVIKGDLIAQLDKRSLDAQRQEQLALRDALQAQLELAELTRERQRDLLSRNVAPEQQFDEARLRAVELEARLRQAEALISGIDIRLEKSGVYAPYAGQIGARFVDEGASVSPGTPVVSVLERTTPRVRIGVSPLAAGSLSIEQNYEIEAQGRHFVATLDRLRPDLDPATRSLTAIFRMKADLAGESPQGLDVLFGEMAQIHLVREVESQGAWVPISALTEGYRGLWNLYVVDESDEWPRVQRESVEVLYANERQAFVRGSFLDGERYVFAGTHRLTVGQRVQYPEEDHGDGHRPGAVQ